MEKSAYITIETDNTGFTFVKNHDEFPYWLVDHIEANLSAKFIPEKGETETIGKVVYDNSEKEIIETVDR